MAASGREATGEVTELLAAFRRGDREALDRLLPMVYRQLRRIAGHQMRGERAGHTLHPTALVHEAYLKLLGGVEVDFEDRAHFLGVAARAMREILVDAARRRQAQKRGGEWQRTTLDGEALGLEAPLVEVLDLDRALAGLERLESRLRQVVELRFFGGLTEEETAAALEVTARTVRRDWVKARAWLYKELYQAPAAEQDPPPPA
jgi:RNA polymerase sigma factor (TIGR02999 family)